jgi:CDP-glycerol glycerophosphotransferase (TagB/SpsB family)
MKKSDFEMPKEWKGKVHTDRKVLLFNMHLSYYLKAYSKVKEGAESNYALNRLEEMLPKILNNDKYSLIWRPHPLMKQMIISRLGVYPKELEEIEEAIRSSNNAVIDVNADYRYGFYFADALISSFSSMVTLFSVLGKPIYIYQTRLDRNVTKDSPVDYDVFYYRHGKNRTEFKTFLNYLDNGEDPLYEDRMKVLPKSFVNMDGGAGKTIHKTVIDYCNS